MVGWLYCWIAWLLDCLIVMLIHGFIWLKIWLKRSDGSVLFFELAVESSACTSTCSVELCQNYCQSPVYHICTALHLTKSGSAAIIWVENGRHTNHERRRCGDMRLYSVLSGGKKYNQPWFTRRCPALNWIGFSTRWLVQKGYNLQWQWFQSVGWCR